ncbi:transcriptional regulator LysR family [Cupriavidus necator N-1]|jgi:DNA-binding transcriptional LysR family regulator|uniref:Transcriptional regulator LysR family n=1 Tax=Cupriavidus necator (strain ATCC 43291 / DSM 13513 / CCUG 52238 / LMG 8453 / N-1) TaxID=1042878 RepID=F8GTI9_CUPNN|nr:MULTISPECIES: LysR family transcriptional regulator [Cupriavidus]AEI81235.1 transcriptional regulator LysR family [Cupriavidus necator N-1]KAI3596020.1 Transcriptional regulator, LysR family [Cupriavidus necator H850]MDX6009148.1 LysR family transcriptional regulator [Cupriavidus necator]QUN25863.1 LysR family transcriptional regulator [Cupriavidus sp. KK10]
MLPTLKQIQHFVAIAETGQVSRAAQRCNVSQSSMTASLKGLEDVVGAPLFSRHAAGVKLTAAGIRFLRHAQQIEAAVRDAVSAAAVTPSTVTGAIRLGVTETITAYVLPKLLPALEQKFPLLELEILERPRGDIEADIQAGKLDLALLLVSNLPEMHHIGCETLLRSPRQLWGHPDHPLMQLEQISLTDVARHDYILLDMDEHIATVIKYWRQYGLTPSVRLQSCSIEAVRSLVAAGRGVSILSDLVYRLWSLEGQRILRRSLSDRVPSMDVGLIWRLDPGPDEHTHALREFLRIALLETMR